MKKIIAIFTVLIAISAIVVANPVLVRVADTSMVIYDTLELPIYADSTFTGKDVTALQLDLTFSDDYFEILEVSVTGCLLSGFSVFEYSTPMSGRLKISAANATPLSGKGKLLKIKLRAKKNGSSNFSFTTNGENILNQGDPAMSTKYGRISIAALPAIGIYPANVVLTSGDMQQFSASGGTAPYTWSITTDSIGTINGSGLFTAHKRGKTKIVVTDSQGFRDTSLTFVEVRALELSMNDTTCWQGNRVTIPIRTTSINGLGILSGMIELTFDDDRLEALSLVTNGTLTDGVSAEIGDRSPGKIKIAFSSATAISGEGILVKVEFRSIGSTGNSALNFGEILFNQDILANTDAAWVNVQSLPLLSVTPATSQLSVGDTQQFAVSNNVGPVTWSVSDNQVATISQAGLLQPQKSGKVKVQVVDSIGSSGETEEITVYAAEVSIEQVIVSVDNKEIFEVPVTLDMFSTADSIFAFEGTFSFDTAFLNFEGISPSGTMADGWAVSGGAVFNVGKIAGAGTSNIAGTGVLVKLLFSYTDKIATGNYSNLDILSWMFNEGQPYTLTANGGITASEGIQNDLGISAITSPVNSCEGFGMHTITVTVTNYKNEIYQAVWPVELAYVVNNSAEVSEIVNLASDIPVGGSTNITFSTGYDFATAGYYKIEAYTKLTEDMDKTNDSTSINIGFFSLPEIDLGQDIQTNSLPVTLDAGPDMDNYLWNDESTQQTLSVETSGTYWVEVTKNNCSNRDTVIVSYVVSVGTPAFEDIRVYPNPASRYVHIAWPYTVRRDVKLFDLTGKLVLSTKIAGNGQHTLDVSKLNKGIFYLIIEEENTYKPVKLILY